MRSLGEALRGGLATWVATYVDHDLYGYDAAQVRAFDYTGPLLEGMALGESIAAHVPEGIKLEIYMPTNESVAAGCTLGDAHDWCRETGQWQRTFHWCDKFSSDGRG